MTKLTNASHLRSLLKTIGPGLIFASSAIGTSHLVLSTRAGAHHGMIFFWIILAALLLKYPFFEFGPRYANATGHSLLKGYKEQGLWAIVLFMVIIGINMFAVTGAIAAVSAGLLSTVFNFGGMPVPILAGIIIAITLIILLIGGYKGLDNLIKLISIILLITVVTAFLAVLFKGPVQPAADFQSPAILKGAGLALLISLLGWMPSGMEASAMTSIWVIEKERSTQYHPSLKESLLDFNLGYFFTIVLALMFLIIGAFTVYGTGQLLEGNATQFSQKLFEVFTSNLGAWSYPVIAIAAFGTIYGTLIAVMDAFPRCFAGGLRVIKFQILKNDEVQHQFLNRYYKLLLVIVSLGGFFLFYFSAVSMIKILEGATILAFLTSPVIAFLNLRAVQQKDFPESHRPSKRMIYLAYSGLFGLVVFSIYYLINL